MMMMYVLLMKNYCWYYSRDQVVRSRRLAASRAISGTSPRDMKYNLTLEMRERVLRLENENLEYRQMYHRDLMFAPVYIGYWHQMVPISPP